MINQRLKVKNIVFLVIFIAIIITPVKNTEREVNISIVGDILLSRDVAKVINKNGVYYPYGKTKDLLVKSDIVFGNLEGPVTNGVSPAIKMSSLIFKADPSSIPPLKEAGINVLSLANNHSMDYGSKGMLDTLKYLEANGILSVGGGKNQESAHKPTYINKNGIIIGIMSFSTFPAEGHFFFKDKPDIAYIDEKGIGREIKAAKDKCNWLIVSFHWGKEYSFYASENQKKLAHVIADNGADLVIGQHPHVLQGIEKYKNAYIFYSLGSFVFDNTLREGTADSMILNLKISRNNIKNIKIIPISIKNCQPFQSNTKDANRILENINKYSLDLNEQIRIDGNIGLVK